MYADKIYNMCYYISKNKSEADDLFQEVIIKVYKYLKGFDGKSKFSTWLYRITTNHCIDRIRHYDRVSFFSLDKADEDGLELITKMSDKSPGPAEEAQKQDTIQKLGLAIETLSPIQKTIVLLRYSEDKPLKEIAQICRCTVGTVGSRLDSAMKKLKKYLKLNP